MSNTREQGSGQHLGLSLKRLGEEEQPWTDFWSHCSPGLPVYFGRLDPFLSHHGPAMALTLSHICTDVGLDSVSILCVCVTRGVDPSFFSFLFQSGSSPKKKAIHHIKIGPLVHWPLSNYNLISFPLSLSILAKITKKRLTC